MAKAGVKAERAAAERRRMAEILRILRREYPESRCSLEFHSPFQLLAATILSAQCTDERVNKTTPALFARYPDARAMAAAPLGEIEKLIRSTGFFRAKAKSLQAASRALVELYGGRVPREIEALTNLRGVGRKTANVVRGVAFGEPGLVVDTHVKRLSRRMGFTRQTDPVKIEKELCEIVPQEDWTAFGHLMIDHGRAVCDARKPLCGECAIAKWCPKVGV